jgi:hypothetical protein
VNSPEEMKKVGGAVATTLITAACAAVAISQQNLYFREVLAVSLLLFYPNFSLSGGAGREETFL